MLHTLPCDGSRRPFRFPGAGENGVEGIETEDPAARIRLVGLQRVRELQGARALECAGIDDIARHGRDHANQFGPGKQFLKPMCVAELMETGIRLPHGFARPIRLF